MVGAIENLYEMAPDKDKAKIAELVVPLPYLPQNSNLGVKKGDPRVILGQKGDPLEDIISGQFPGGKKSI